MSKKPRREKKRKPRQPARGAAMVQATAVGFAFVGSLFLITLIFLATGSGSETGTIWVFPVWVVLFVFLIWNVATVRQALTRGLALLGAEFLALPLAWLIYQGLPSLTAADPRLQQTVPVMGFGLVPAAVLLAASFMIARRTHDPLHSNTGRLLIPLAAVVFAAEAVYGIVLWMSLLRGSG